VLATGARKQEALGLRWGQVNLKRHTITYHGKGKKVRTVPLPQGMVDILQQVYDERCKPATMMHEINGDLSDICVFPSDNDPCVPTQNIHSAWKKAITRAGLTDVVEGTSLRPHDLRHVMASNTIVKGSGDIQTVAVLLGHADLRMASRYAHLQSSHLTNVVEKMGQNIPL